MNGAPWTPEEDAIVARHYPVHGPHWDGWGRLLGWRTERAIERRAFLIGAVQRKKAHWTEEEDRVLMLAVLHVSKATGRTPLAVVSRCHRLVDKALRERGKGA